MHRFCTVVLIFCLSIISGLGDENKETAVKSAGSECYGCENTLNPNRPIYREMAQEALKVYLRRVGSHRLHQVVQVERVTEQFVAGEVTRITFTAVPSNCNNVDLVQPVDWSNLLQCKLEKLIPLVLIEPETKVSCVKVRL
ncbi:unnamed protein product [Euphydryas editha]|uniref:Cystatin domain-containing protein n=1 Tax=Euphydryas editha TaxID=104508 RepID=A0AAU9U610_EUPED|nr:unnamed protein product [Euphydryas editha]